jgi:hypothetical protein
MKRYGILCLLIVLSLLPVTALAGSLIYDPYNTCTSINCSSQSIHGTYHSDSLGDRDPFILQIYSFGDECVRLDVTNETHDLEMVLISPTGRIWRNDDRAYPDNRRPLIKAITDVSGWYTLQISHYTGADVIADFTLRYGRYNAGNPNCSSVTPPVVTSEIERDNLKSSGSEMTIENVPPITMPR